MLHVRHLILCLVLLVCAAYGQVSECTTATVVNADALNGAPYIYTFDIAADTTTSLVDICRSALVPDAGGGTLITAARFIKIVTGNTPYQLTVDSCSSMLDSGWQILTSTTQDCPAGSCWIATIVSARGTCPGGNTGARRITYYPLGKNQQYFMLIYGTTFYGGTGLGRVQGSLTFSVISSPVNDACANAIPIAPRAYIFGTTDGAGPDPVYSVTTACNAGTPLNTFSNSQFSPDVWYSFNSGNSPAAYIYSCGGFSLKFYSSFFISSGGCDTSDGDQTTCLASVQGASANSGCPSFTGGGNLYYPSLTPNTDYLIRVSGFAEALGEFFFFLYLAEDNARCSAAVPITTLPFTFTGSVDAAPPDNRCTSNVNAVFFSINSGPYGAYDVSVDTCSSNFDTTISLSTSCAVPTCFSQIDDGCASGTGSMLTGLNIPANTQYFIRVASKAMAVNSTYTLSVTGRFVDANGACTRPVTVSSVPFSFSGSTRGADSVSVCGGTASPASWFSFNTGVGYASLFFSVSNSLNIRIVSACGAPSCVASGSSISLNNVAANQQWLIAVTGGTGDYSLAISGASYQSPVIICPADLLVQASASTCQYSGTTGIPTLISIDGAAASFTKSPRGPYAIGINQVRYTAVHSRNSELRSSCVQQVTVNGPAGC